MSEFGQNLKKALAFRSLTEARAAQLCRVKQQTMNYYCNLKKPPHENIVQRLVFNLGIPAKELLGSKPGWAVKESSMEYRPTDPRIIWCESMKLRWRQRVHRDELALAIRILFDHDADAVIKWLNEDKRAG